MRTPIEVIFLDMDGVIAEFSNPLTGTITIEDEDWTAPGIFINKKPVKAVLSRLQNLTDQMYIHTNSQPTLAILSASPNDGASEEKDRWLDKHFPEIEERHYLPYPGESKSQFIFEYSFQHNIPLDRILLIDDTHRHLFECSEYGIKVMHPSVLLARY